MEKIFAWNKMIGIKHVSISLYKSCNYCL